MKKLHCLFIVILFSCNLLAEETIRVKTARLADIAIYPERSAPASVISLNESMISSRIEAQVEDIPVRVGNIVEKDSVLAKLDCSDFILASKESSANLESLKSQIELAKRRLGRTQTLTLKQSVSEELLDERESDLSVLQANYRAAKAQHEQAKINESRCIVSSPFRALVTERSSAIGQFVNIGTALVKIIDIEHLEVSAQVFSIDTEQINQSDELSFEYANIKYPLKLRAINPAINIETQTREVRLLFIDKPELPGAAGKLIWKDKRAHIPGEYLVRRDGELGVFTINNNKASFIPVPTAQAGRASPTTLPVDTLLVIEGQFSLKEDDVVTVQN